LRPPVYLDASWRPSQRRLFDLARWGAIAPGVPSR